ncbi:hypothetical protein CCP4SC76_5540002 [Gammaproteobacteria bacterium]
MKTQPSGLPALQTVHQGLPPSLPSRSIVLDEYELAAYWQISVKTVRRWRRELLGPAFCRVGNRVVYPLSEIDAFERRMSRNAAPLRAYR